MLKVNNENTKAKSLMSFIHCPSVSIVDFEQVTFSLVNYRLQFLKKLEDFMSLFMSFCCSEFPEQLFYYFAVLFIWTTISKICILCIAEKNYVVFFLMPLCNDLKNVTNAPTTSIPPVNIKNRGFLVFSGYTEMMKAL